MNTYVNAVWSEFNREETHPHIGLHKTLMDASMGCDPKQDIILEFNDRKMAERYVNAFKNLCETAWSPNQSDAEMRGHDQMIIDTKRLLSQLEKYSNKMEPMA